MKTLRLSRRAVLRGSLGACLSLPLLEAMLDGNAALAQSATQARRYAVFFGGFSLGADGDPMHDDLVPHTVGANYDLRTATQSFAADDVKQRISIISRLRMPQSGSAAVKFNWHGGNHSPLLAGTGVATSDDAKNARLKAETSDQLVAADFLSRGVKTPFASLQLKVQAKAYSPGPSLGYIMSARRNPQTAALEALAPTVSPRQIYERLFFQTPTGSGITTAERLELQTRRSVLDYCAEDRSGLMAKLGAEDRHRLEGYFTQCRELEERLGELEEEPTCVAPADPGSDPALGPDSNVSLNESNYTASSGYSNEELRATVMMELLHAAFVCDLTRVASVVMSHNQSFMNMYGINGQTSDVHALSHFTRHTPRTTEMARSQAWHYKHFAALVQKLHLSKDPSGKSLLETSALAFVNEGGHGPADFGGAAGGAHSAENMAVVIAGGAGGLKQGQHIPVPGAHPGQVLLTLMNAVGVATNRFGELTGALPSLIGV